MAFKFGKIFEDMLGEGWKKISKSAMKNFQPDENLKKVSDKAKAALKDLESEFQNVGKRADEVGKAIKDVEDTMASGSLNATKMAEAQHDLNSLYEESTSIEDEYQDLLKKRNKILNSETEIVRRFSNMKSDQFAQKAIDAFGDIAESALGLLGPVGEIIGAAAGPAIEQLVQLNDQLIQLQRNTGGMASAARLGFDAFGNSATGMESLATQAAKANISVEQFGASMQDLFSGALKAGQVAGLADDLNKSGDALKNYGIEAARIEKLYGAKIGPAVGNLMSNFGLGIKDATKLVKDGVDTTRQLGLNVQAFTQNLQEATDLAGEFYFKTADQMTKLAGLATQLGTSVSAIAGGVVKMNGITDLFNKQQTTAALGLSTFSKNLSKAYALQAQGRGAEAAQVQLQSLAKDLIRNGLTDKTGQITQQGIATASAAGASQEQIQALQKMARNAQKAGLALDQAFDPSKLTESQKRRLAAAEQENQTIQETFSNMFGEIKGLLLDPLAQVFTPIIKSLAAVLQPVIKIFAGLVGIIEDAALVLFEPVKELFAQVSATLSDIFTPIQNAVQNLRNALAPMFNMLKGLGSFIVKFIMMPFRIVGRVIGGIVDVVGKVIKVIGEKLAPVFEWFSGLFSEGGSALEGVLDAITDAFGWLADVVGGAIGLAFDALGAIIGTVVDALGWLWDGLVALWDGLNEYVITPIMDFLGPAFEMLGDVIDWVTAPFKWLIDAVKKVIEYFNWFGDDENKTSELTPEDWKQVLGTEDNAVPNAIAASNPSAQGVADAQQAVYAAGSEQQRRNEEAINKVFSSGGGTSQVANKQNISIHVDPTFGNKQIVKEG